MFEIIKNYSAVIIIVFFLYLFGLTLVKIQEALQSIINKLKNNKKG